MTFKQWYSQSWHGPVEIGPVESVWLNASILPWCVRLEWYNHSYNPTRLDSMPDRRPMLSRTRLISHRPGALFQTDSHRLGCSCKAISIPREFLTRRKESTRLNVTGASAKRRHALMQSKGSKIEALVITA